MVVGLTMSHSQHGSGLFSLGAEVEKSCSQESEVYIPDLHDRQQIIISILILILLIFLLITIIRMHKATFYSHIQMLGSKGFLASARSLGQLLPLLAPFRPAFGRIFWGVDAPPHSWKSCTATAEGLAS